MRYTKTTVLRLLALMLVLAFCLAGCGGKKDGQGDGVLETTVPPTPSAPVTPVEPTDPPVLTAHGKLLSYLNDKGAVKVEEQTYTFIMRAEGGKIIWEYKNDSTNITLTLTDGAATQPVVIKFAMYDAVAEVDVASYSSNGGELTNFQCFVPSMTQSVKNMATSAVKTCFMQAARLMEPSGVNLVELGFVGYYS